MIGTRIVPVSSWTKSSVSCEARVCFAKLPCALRRAYQTIHVRNGCTCSCTEIPPRRRPLELPGYVLNHPYSQPDHPSRLVVFGVPIFLFHQFLCPPPLPDF